MVLPVSTCGVLVRGLLLAALAVVGAASLYQLFTHCAPHNSAWEVQIIPYGKLVTRRYSFPPLFHYLSFSPLFLMETSWGHEVLSCYIKKKKKLWTEWQALTHFFYMSRENGSSTSSLHYSIILSLYLCALPTSVLSFSVFLSPLSTLTTV